MKNARNDVDVLNDEDAALLIVMKQHLHIRSKRLSSLLNDEATTLSVIELNMSVGTTFHCFMTPLKIVPVIKSVLC